MKTIKRLLRYIKPFKKNLIAAVISAFIGILFSLLVPVFIGYGVDAMVGVDNVDFKRLIQICIALAAIILISALFQWIMTYHSNKLTYYTVEQMRNDVMEKLTRVPLSFIDSTPHGDLINTVVTDIDIVGTGLLQGFTQVFSGIVTILGTLVFMFTINPIIALVVVVLTPLSFFVASFIAKHSHDKYREQAKLRGKMTGYASEMIECETLVKAYSMEESVEENFDKMNRDLQKVGVIAHFYSALSNPCTRFVNAMVYAGVAIAGAYLCVTGKLSVGALTSFLAYCSQYTKPFNEISGVVAEFQNAVASANRVFQLLDTENESDDSALEPLAVQDGTVGFSHVDFAYSKKKPLIRDFNLDVKSGQTIAIVGPTGCGKTTMINLLMRFYDVNAGKITVDGKDIRSVTRDSLRGAFGMVLQDTWLFRGTVRENIAYGVPDATDEEIREAAKKAHAHSFIKRLPNGYDTVLTENGDNISEGQKQLLCIARVMLKRPPMLILDEATSNIDTRTEVRIQKAFAALMEGRTSFIVAHRLSTIRNADVILVMRDGQIIEKGKHEELLAQNGFYAQLYNSQFAVQE
ncbi:MAG TPA: ABC transporter ATP-binding protein [Candidatus Fimenecus excrementavium]|nr:ABC transporter ATP-binding protein [Candidatus Fimenecus excrementavium]